MGAAFVAQENVGVRGRWPLACRTFNGACVCGAGKPRSRGAGKIARAFCNLRAMGWAGGSRVICTRGGSRNITQLTRNRLCERSPVFLQHRTARNRSCQRPGGSPWTNSRTRTHERSLAASNRLCDDCLALFNYILATNREKAARRPPIGRPKINNQHLVVVVVNQRVKPRDELFSRALRQHTAKDRVLHPLTGSLHHAVHLAPASRVADIITYNICA